MIKPQPIASTVQTIMPVKAKQEERTWLSTGVSTVSRTISNIIAKAKEHKKAIAVGAAALGSMYATYRYLHAEVGPSTTSSTNTDAGPSATATGEDESWSAQPWLIRIGLVLIAIRTFLSMNTHGSSAAVNPSKHRQQQRQAQPSAEKFDSDDDPRYMTAQELREVAEAAGKRVGYGNAAAAEYI